MCGGLNQRLEEIGVVVVMTALKQRSDTLQTHAGVDGLHFQRHHRPIIELFVLHENDVPNLDEAVAIFLRRTWRATPDVIAVVVENFCTWPARTRWPHAPEVVIGRNANDPILWNPKFFPNVERLIIRVIDGRHQLRLVDTEIFGQQFPRKWDRFIFEVVAKAEVTEHFKKRVVTRCIAHVVEVVVLAPCADAFL